MKNSHHPVLDRTSNWCIGGYCFTGSNRGIDKKNSATEGLQAMGGAGRNPGRASVGCLPPMQRMISNLRTLQNVRYFCKNNVPYIFVKSLKLKAILV
jgi:hypothetical protein